MTLVLIILMTLVLIMCLRLIVMYVIDVIESDEWLVKLLGIALILVMIVAMSLAISGGVRAIEVLWK